MKKERFFKYTGKNASGHMLMYFTTNRVYKLMSLGRDKHIIVINDNGDEYHISSEFFEEVTEEPINLDKKLDELKTKITQIKKNIKERDAYKVGDIVVLVSKRPMGWNFEGHMDEFLGRVVKIAGVGKIHIDFVGISTWAFSPSDIERKATTEEIYAFETTKLPKLPNIGGYEGMDYGTSIVYGCRSMQKTTLLSMQEEGVTSLTVGASSITKEEFARIINYIKKTS